MEAIITMRADIDSVIFWKHVRILGAKRTCLPCRKLKIRKRVMRKKQDNVDEDSSVSRDGDTSIASFSNKQETVAGEDRRTHTLVNDRRPI